MEVRKTTLLSFLVCIAGILTEIIFRDVLAKSALGVALSVLLAVVIIVLAYFFYDGLYSFLTVEREIERKRQEGEGQKLYAVLNDQLQFERSIYNEVHALLEASENTDGAEGAVSVKELEKSLKRLEEYINEHAATTVKDGSRYNSMEQIQDEIRALAEKQGSLEQIRDEIQALAEKQTELGSMQNDIQTIITNESELKQNQDEIQSSIRKLAEVMSVLLSLLRRRKTEDEKS